MVLSRFYIEILIIYKRFKKKKKEATSHFYEGRTLENCKKSKGKRVKRLCEGSKQEEKR